MINSVEMDSIWRTIDTLQHDIFIDVVFASTTNKDYRIRLTNVCRTDNHSLGWIGVEKIFLSEYFRPTHWAYIKLPKADKYD